MARRLSARVMGGVQLAQARPGDVRIDLRRRDVGMAQQASARHAGRRRGSADEWRTHGAVHVRRQRRMRCRRGLHSVSREARTSVASSPRRAASRRRHPRSRRRATPAVRLAGSVRATIAQFRPIGTCAPSNPCQRRARDPRTAESSMSLNPTSSVTRSPVAYSSSSIARSRRPSAVLSSGAPSNDSTWLSLIDWGNRARRRALRSRIVGSRRRDSRCTQR